MMCVVCDDLGCEFCPSHRHSRDFTRPPVTDNGRSNVQLYNRCYWLHIQSRDIGYGIEEYFGEFVYRGLFDSWGKHEWIPVDGAHPLYLFPDEVLSIGEGCA